MALNKGLISNSGDKGISILKNIILVFVEGTQDVTKSLAISQNGHYSISNIFVKLT